MTQQPLTDQQLDDIEARAARLYERTASIDANAHPDFGQLTDADVPALLAEIRRQRAILPAALTALQERAGELQELAEEQMRPSLEERAQEWLEAAAIVQRISRKGAQV